MYKDGKLTVFSVGNGDTILIEAHGKTVLTDVHHCTGKAEDDDEYLDFTEDLKAACSGNRLDIFVSTHPDVDHLRGFEEIFHTGDARAWEPYPANGVGKILVDEIWCSPYGLTPNYITKDAEPLIEEIKRRNMLRGTPEGALPGNKLRVMDMEAEETAGEITPGLKWRLLAPTKAEWDIPPAAEGESNPSSNDSSLVIRWTVTIDGTDSLILLGGDATVEVWDRIGQEIHGKATDDLAWHILVAPHHCSRHTLGYTVDSDEGEFENSPDAVKALSEVRGKGHVVSSSKRLNHLKKSPPSTMAKNHYLKLLAKGGEVDEAIRERFVCTGGDADNEDPAHVIFTLTGAGPTRSKRPKAPAVVASVGGGFATGRGGGYG